MKKETELKNSSLSLEEEENLVNEETEEKEKELSVYITMIGNLESAMYEKGSML